MSNFIKPLSIFATGVLNFVTSLVPFSIAKFALPLFFLLNIGFIVYHLYKKEWLLWIPKIMLSIIYVYFSFVFFHGYGFNLPPMSEALPYSIEKQSTDVLTKVTEMVIEDLNNVNTLILRDEKGIVIFDDFKTATKKINQGYISLMDKYSFTRHKKLGRAKAA